MSSPDRDNLLPALQRIAFYQQAGVGDVFEYYENSDPGTHNFELDNRQQFYRFVGRHFYPETKTSPGEITSNSLMI